MLSQFSWDDPVSLIIVFILIFALTALIMAIFRSIKNKNKDSDIDPNEPTDLRDDDIL